MAVDDVTPTDAEARAWFARGVDDAYSLTADPRLADADILFDRWLTAHDRRVDALIRERESGDISINWTDHGLDLTWTMGSLRIRTRGCDIPAELVRVNPDSSCYTLAWWRDKGDGPRFESIGSRLFQDVDPGEAAAVWRQFRIVQTVLDLGTAGGVKGSE